MTILKQPDDAQYRVECTIAKLDEIETELEAEKAVAHVKGYISALRYSEQIGDEHFKRMVEALDRALRDWHLKHDKL
ncbi:MAG: hypothetical protein AB1704_16635 [Pseudomonadota bacterium]|jgi:hypothetical protein|uniref:hypothetical protein n=1 Tax=Burkholderiaceae TaxID=119060 RepID=UPI0010F595D0|nr:hypothetical protein [Burkholderia sp. 4M9327F10]